MSNKIIKQTSYLFIYRKIMNKAKNTKVTGLILGIILITATYIIPNPENLNIHTWHTLGVALLMACWC